MYQAPAAIWNAIAETGPLRTKWAEQMFPLPTEVLADELAVEESRLTKESGEPLVALAYLVVMPLLWEAEAIRRFKAKVGPVPSLPTVETVDAALAVAQGDYPLTPQEVQILRAMLLREPVA